MTVVHVDFNNLARGGKVIALKSWADGPIYVGDEVIAVDQFDDEMRFEAVVAEEDAASGRIYLSFDAEKPIAEASATHVIYSLDPQHKPLWTYRTLDGSDLGVGESLPYLRDLYRSRSRDRGTGRVIEHVEVRREPGYWLRYTLGEAEDDGTRSYPARVFTATTDYRGGPTATDLAKWGMARNGEPLVIACLPNDTIESVLEQIHSTESVVVTMVADVPPSIGYVSAVTGLSAPKANRRIGGRTQTLAAAGLTVSSTIQELMDKSGIPERIAEMIRADRHSAGAAFPELVRLVTGDMAMVAA